MQNSKDRSVPFHRNTSCNSSGSSSKSNGSHCRIRLKEKFDQSDCLRNVNEEELKSKPLDEQKTILSGLSLNDTRRYLRHGAERLSKTLTSVRVTFGTLSQRFKGVTKRRQILEEGPMTPNGQTPYTKSRQVLGRTPTKLYSPFGIDSPYQATTVDKENTFTTSSCLVKK